MRAHWSSLLASLALVTVAPAALAQTSPDAAQGGEQSTTTAPSGDTSTSADTAAAPNPAALEEAREQYRNGVSLFRARHYADAAIAFDRSFHARPHPTTLYNAAEARLRAGDRTGAVDQLRDMLAMTNPAPGAADVDRARALAREAGVEDLQPRPPQQVDCPHCPVCPPQRECPVCPPAHVTERAPIAPLALAVGGAVVLATGVGFYTAALADAGAYHDSHSLELRQGLKDQGEAFRWVGLVGFLGGLGMEAAAVVLALPSLRGSEHTAARTTNAVTARIDVAPNGLLVSGTF